jgi:hypothetical protein
MIYYTHNRQQSPTISLAFASTKDNILSYWWIAFLQGLIAFGGFMLLIVPGYLFIGWFILSYYVLVIDQHRGLAALQASKHYVVNFWWATMGRLFVFGLLMIPLLLIVVVASLLISSVPGLQIVEPFISTAASLILTPIQIIYLYLIYHYLKQIKGTAPEQPSNRLITWYLSMAIGLFVLIGFIYLFIYRLRFLSII